MGTEFSKDANFPKSDVNSGHARKVKQPCRGTRVMGKFPHSFRLKIMMMKFSDDENCQIFAAYK